MGRTRAKRLRGYGNAIVRPLAVAFVESVIESFVDAARPAVAEERIEDSSAPMVEDLEQPFDVDESLEQEFDAAEDLEQPDAIVGSQGAEMEESAA